MKINRENYMTTGEFARAMGVTKDTLFYYDKIGLFSPEIVLENEYRYYSIYQIEIFDTIMQLKELGMPLVQIRDFLEHRNPEKMLAAFQKRNAQIEGQIRKLKNQKQWLRERISYLLEMERQDWSRIDKIYYPRRYYVYTPIEEKTDAAFLKKTNQAIMDFLKNNQDEAYRIGYLQKASDIQNSIYDNYHNTILITQRKPAKTQFEVLKAGEYLTAYHKGSWDTVGECYERMLSYAEEQELNLSGNYMESYIIDHLFTEQIQEYVTQISVRIL